MAVIPTWKILIVTSIEAAVQFGWALKVSLLTPYLQQLGLDITAALLIWVSTPIFGLVVPVVVGYSSQWLGRTRLGKHKPFIAVGCVIQCAGMILISYVRDIEHVDPESWGTPHGLYWSIRFMFIGGCWAMDLSKSLIEGSVRGFLVDLCQGDQVRVKRSIGWFTLFTTVGNVAGYAVSSYPRLYKIIPFTRNNFCGDTCANLKTCYIINMFLLAIVLYVAFKYVSQPISEQRGLGEHEVRVPCLTHWKEASRKPFTRLYLASALITVAWFPFQVLGSDWVGKEVYGGVVSPDSAIYLAGVREAALGLMVNAVVVGVVSVVFNPLTKALGGLRRTWGLFTLVLAVSLATTLVLKKKAEQARSMTPFGTHPPKGIRIGILTFFGVMGIPQAATLTIPLLLISAYSRDFATNPDRVKVVATALLNVTNAVSDILALALCIGARFNYSMFIVGAATSGISSLLVFIWLFPIYSDT